MYKYILAIASILIISCNGAPEKMAGKIEETAKNEKKTTGKMDPVCEMPYDSTWVDMTIYNGDTVKFCSENCKKAFLVKPTKYIKHS